MYGNTKKSLQDAIENLKREGLYKNERVLTSPQSSTIEIGGGTRVINFCANNYLGLSNNPGIVKAAQETMEKWGYGLSSVRFICGTQQIHKDLEQRFSRFLGTEDSILYAACFDANGGVFEPLIGPEDAIISDALNHASIIDGVRLTKSQRYRYSHSDMQELEQALKDAESAPRKIICTDGVFSMDGDIAKLDKICDLADRYEALVLVDDSHATGYIGPGGRGTPAYYGVQDRVDIITTTFGKALGGASGGCTSGRREIIDLLRQRSRPYLFSNTLAPAIVGASIAVLDVLSASTELRDKITENTTYFREKMTNAGFDIIPGTHPIVPIMLYDAPLSQKFSEKLLEKGIYVIGFFYPVVPKDKARIRVQVSSGHEWAHLYKAIAAFTEVGNELGVIE